MQAPPSLCDHQQPVQMLFRVMRRRFLGPAALPPSACGPPRLPLRRLGLCEGCSLSAPGEPWTEGQCWCQCSSRAPRVGRCRALYAPPEEAERLGRGRRGAGGVTSRGGERTSGSVLAWLGAAEGYLRRLDRPAPQVLFRCGLSAAFCTFGSVPFPGSADLTGSAFAMLTRGGCG